MSLEIQNRRPKIYFAGSSPNITDHNLAVRDLFVKIAKSGFEFSDVDFNLQLGAVNPD